MMMILNYFLLFCVCMDWILMHKAGVQTTTITKRIVFIVYLISLTYFFNQQENFGISCFFTI